ncbi:MAG TPA: class I SAM-dependent rRNA methyltransferase, partial [Candidatus Binataceae bacterium]|nr:class I SAM-dependent rRNA methyltransferase [Candidatus Binataceae bacterium]
HSSSCWPPPAIARAEPDGLVAGDGVEVFDIGGDRLGFGYYNPSTTIAVRMLASGATFETAGIVRRRIEGALHLRRQIIAADTNCYRLVNGDGDALSGVVIDRYGDVAVVQLLTAGAERMRAEIVAALSDLLAPRAIIERSHGAVRRQEGLDDRAGLLAGESVSSAQVRENGIEITVDFDHGQKTGYFLDQRENRAALRELARGASVFDGYCYSGGFAMAALSGGARRVVAVDTSARALGWAQRSLELNHFEPERCKLVHGEAAEYLSESGERFDLIVIDPPPLARSLKDAQRAAHLYVDLNAAAMRALSPGGFLMTFSCSAHFHGEDFLRAVRSAARRAGRNFRMLRRLGPGADHPAMIGHSEGEYLSGALLAEIA